MDVNVVLQFILALGLGALIGMERGIKYKANTRKEKLISFGEIRTFSLISLLGAISAWLSIVFGSSTILVISMILIGVFIAIYYFYSVFKESQLGLTTELSVFITYFLGVFVMLGYGKMAVILAILLTFILSLKGFLDNLTKKISIDELNNTLKFAVISIVVLPLLPDQKYSIADMLGFFGYENELTNRILTLDFFNPYGIWFFVVLMAGISYVGYIMTKIIGEKGSIVLSGAIGGLVSSTAVTASMTEASKKDVKNTDLYVVSTLTASTIMFVRVILIVLFFNINMLNSIIYPSVFMLVGMVLYMWYFYYKSKKKDIHMDDIGLEKKKYKSPFSVGPALKFAAFVLFIKFVAGVGGLYQDIWGDYFFYALGIISGLADVDAISQTMAVDALDEKVGLSLAAMTIIIAVISNNFVKGGIAWKFGEKRFGRSVMLGFVISMIMGIIGIGVLNIMN
ncbi:MAG: MgtC/SapB family protein [Candidatus Gracilibacteria bacterium]|nr:MgtC/SapB family protein [Candidatus Gracilibacteria bacterium]